MRSPNQLLIRLGKVACEKLGATWKHPGTPICDLDAREDVRRMFVELVLHSLPRIRGDRRYVDKANNAIIGAGARDGRSAVGMTDEEDRASDTVERTLHRRQILG